MKTTKVMMTGFAIFAAMLMLMAPCMARPAVESINVKAVETQQDLMNSLEALIVKLSRDAEASASLDSITKDRNVVFIVNNMQRATTEEEMMAGFEQLGNIIEQEYSYEAGVISQQIGMIDGGDDDDDLPDSDDLNDFLIWLLKAFIKAQIQNLINILIMILLWWLRNRFGSDDDGGDGSTPAL